MVKTEAGVIEELDLFPLDVVFLNPRQKVQALTARGGLSKGATYWIKAVHSSGKVALHDEPGKLFEMRSFVGIRTYSEADPAAMPVEAGTPSPNRRVPANDNGAKA